MAQLIKGKLKAKRTHVRELAVLGVLRKVAIGEMVHYMHEVIRVEVSINVFA